MVGSAVQEFALSQFITMPDAIRSAFDKDGIIVIVDLYDGDTCERINAEAKAVADAQGREGQTRFKPLLMVHRLSDAFLSYMAFSSTLTVIESLYDMKPSGLGSEFFFMAPGTRGFVQHQDNDYVGALPDAFVSVWAALCDASPDNGCLYCYPGSHKLGRLAVENVGEDAGMSQDANARSFASILPADSKIEAVDLPMRKGSVAVFHSQLVHGSHDNVSDRFRYALLNTYIRPGTPFRAGKSAKRTEVPLYD